MGLANRVQRTTLDVRRSRRSDASPLVPGGADRLAATILDRASAWLADPVSATLAVVGGEPLAFLDAARRIGWPAFAVAPDDPELLGDRCHHVVADLDDLAVAGRRPTVGLWAGGAVVPPAAVAELAGAVVAGGVVVVAAGSSSPAGGPPLTPAYVAAARAALAGSGLCVRDEWYPPGVRRQVVFVATRP